MTGAIVSFCALDLVHSYRLNTNNTKKSCTMNKVLETVTTTNGKNADMQYIHSGATEGSR